MPEVRRIDVDALRTAVLTAGFQPVAVETRGKRPVVRDWQHADGLPIYDPAALNTGLLCAGLRAVDVDVDDAADAKAIVHAIERELGPAPRRIRANSPRCLLLYRAAEGEPPKRTIPLRNGKVEILGAGQQFVAFGTHSSGVAIEWLDATPADVPRDDLPAVTEQQVDSVVAMLTERFGLPPEPVRMNGASRPNGAGHETTTVEDVESALAALPNDYDRDGWVKVGMAFHEGGGSFEGFDAWSRQHSTYDARETRTAWKSFAGTREVTVGSLFREVFDRVPSWRRPSQEHTADGPSRSSALRTPQSRAPANDPPDDQEREEPLPFLDVAALEGKPLPPREWAVPGVLPLKNVGLLSGHGGSGKTQLIVQLASATVIAGPWLTHMIETAGPALVVCCEDDADEMHRRIAATARLLGVSFAELAAGGLTPLPLPGQSAVMAEPDKRGILRPTRLFERFRDAARDLKPRLIGLDNVADIYGGDENKRPMVRQFITLLRGLALEVGAHILMTLHPSLTGLSTGTGLSGNTAWFNSVRSQLYLKYLAAESEETGTDDSPLRELVSLKNQHGELAKPLVLRWRDGVFVVNRDERTQFERMASERQTDNLFLTLLDRFNRNGRTCSANPSRSYAPTLFESEPETVAAGLTARALEASMRRLFAANAIVMEETGPPSKRRGRLVRVPSNDLPTASNA